MLFYLYDTKEEVEAVDSLICQGENIGTDSTDVTNRYADGMLIETGEHQGKYSYLCDSVTSKYIKDREPIEINF